MLAVGSLGTVCLRCSIRLRIGAASRNLTTSTSSGSAARPWRERSSTYDSPRGLLTTTSRLQNDPASQPAQHLDTHDAILGLNAETSGDTTLEPREDVPETFSDPLPTLDQIATAARNEFGDVLPEGHLTEEQFRVYVRLFGEPLRILAKKEMLVEQQDTQTLQKEQADGVWQTVEEQVVDEYEEEEGEQEEDVAAGYEPAPARPEEAPWPGDEYIRTHPYTAEGRFGTSPSTIQFPQATFTKPIASLLSPTKHVAQAAERCLGGVGLPYSPSTPKISRTMEQKPIGLSALQTRMSDMDADAYMAAVMPQTYASITSVLVEIRKRLGAEWLQGLLNKEGGPLVLDAGAGGAGVLAWREILKAEWEPMNANRKSLFRWRELPVPLGKATVVTGSDTLRYRSSKLLDETTFIPRLPDHVPLEQAPSATPRKQYDLIIAPHTLWRIKLDHRRKQHVQNLWSLLNPKGGILILLEKGVPRGFEAVAGARDLLLNKHISSPGSTTFEVNIADPRSVDGRYATKEEGMIIAPCTNHVTCPLYKTAGLARGRKDWCHFTQRYIRPTFLQHVLGAKSRNHDDVEFSYLAVRRGVDLRKSEPVVVQGKKATDEAFEGYGERRNRTILDEADEEEALQDHESALDIFAEREHEIALAAPASIIPDPVLPALTTATAAAPNTAKSPPHTLTLPRTILEPVKRKGHVLVDVCTPAGSYERWMVKRKCGTQAYRDARKARWGDLWALGAWSRSPRRINVGVVVGAGGRRGAGGRGRKGARERGRKQDDDAEDEDE